MSPPRQRVGMIRSYTPTGGIATPSQAGLDRFTVLTADASKPAWGLAPEPHWVMALCGEGSLSIAEVGHYLGLPCAVVTVIVSRLIDSGHLVATAPVPVSAHSLDFLEKVLHGLQQI